MKNYLVLSMLVFCGLSINSLFAAGVPTLVDAQKEFHVINLRTEFLDKGISAGFRRCFPKEVKNLQGLIDRHKQNLTARERAEVECQIDRYSICLVDKLVSAKYEEITNAAGADAGAKVRAGDVNRGLETFIGQQQKEVAEAAIRLDLPPLKIDDSPIKGDDDVWTLNKFLFGGDNKYLTYAAITSAVGLTIYYWDNINAWFAGQPTDSTQPA